MEGFGLVGEEFVELFVYCVIIFGQVDMYRVVICGRMFVVDVIGINKFFEVIGNVGVQIMVMCLQFVCSEFLVINVE